MRWALLASAVVLTLLPGLGCTLLDRPSNRRDWSPDQAVLPRAEIGDRMVAVHQVRHCTYLDAETYVAHYDDRAYDLERLESVDFILVPFGGLPAVAHTMLSFGFADGQYLCLSVEIRREKGEAYQFLNGILNRYELMYVLGDERDLVKLRTNYRNDDVYIYPLRVSRDEARAIFLDVMERVNTLARRPEFYHTFTNNCTTNVLAHLNRGLGGRIPRGLGILLSGYADRVLYDAGAIATDLPFAEARRRAWVSGPAREFAESPDFSQRIRR